MPEHPPRVQIPIRGRVCRAVIRSRVYTDRCERNQFAVIRASIRRKVRARDHSPLAAGLLAGMLPAGNLTVAGRGAMCGGWWPRAAGRSCGRSSRRSEGRWPGDPRGKREPAAGGESEKLQSVLLPFFDFLVFALFIWPQIVNTRQRP